MTTAAEVREAETVALRQRMAGAKLLQVDYSKTRDDGDRALVAMVVAAAAEDPAVFMALIEKPAVNTLFCCGALHFGTGI